MATASLVNLPRRSVNTSIALSVVMIAAGLLAILVPPIAGVAATVVVASLLIVSGAAHLVFGWHTRGVGALILELILGFVYIAAGFYLVTHLAVGLAALTLALGAYLFAESILEFALAWRIRMFGGSGWLIVDGIVTFALALMISMTWPSSSVWAIGTLIGVSMLFSGISRLMLSMGARRILGATH